MKTWIQSNKLQEVRYDIRGKVLKEALALEAQGHTILKLNIGNTAPFGVMAAENIISKMKQSLGDTQGYTHSQGIGDAREAIAQYYTNKHNIPTSADDVFMGNGASELIVMCMQTLCNPGDEVLIPSPDYPLWTAAANLSGANVQHYVCDESSEWNPDIQDIKSKITSKTKALVLINPNNPTGAVYSKEILQEIAKLCIEKEILIFSDEIYEKIIYEGENHLMASFTDDFPCIFFGGLSKAFRMPGFRCGWMCIKDPKKQLTQFRAGLDTMSSMRLCSNTPPQQIVRECLENDNSIYEMTAAGGQLYQRRQAIIEGLSDIPGISFVAPKGAMYVFPRLDTKKFSIFNDETFALDFLKEKHVLIVHGTGFNWKQPDHFRIVMLPDPKTLIEATKKLKSFLESYSQ